MFLATKQVIENEQSSVNPIVTMFLAGMAGAMAWGIRGQYGHETGAMIAGVLVGFILVVLHGSHLSNLSAARAVAMFALGISVGGSMTYGQTVGLTHDSVFVGNNEAYRWGMLGLAIKGGIWIAWGATLFGMGLSGKRYPWWELAIVFGLLILALVVGRWWLNSPFDREAGVVPNIYFSHYAFWEAKQDRPRPECWGGLLVSLSVLFVYLAAKRDWLALSLGLWGLVGGAIGFPAGQSLQAYNAWHGEWVRSLPTSSVTNYFNWWNLMETAFGFVMGAIVGLGCWWHRAGIGRFVSLEESETDSAVAMPPYLEWILLIVHVRLLVAWNFQSFDSLDFVADMAVPMIVIPAIGVMTGRYWPFLVALPVTLLPIAGKTMRQLHLSEKKVPWIENTDWFQWLGEIPAGQSSWDMYLVVPMLVALGVACWFASRSSKYATSRSFAPVGCILAAWLYFYLNNAFFHSPWPWREWTGRTVHGAIFFFAAVCLTIASSVRLALNNSVPPATYREPFQSP